MRIQTDRYYRFPAPVTAVVTTVTRVTGTDVRTSPTDHWTRVRATSIRHHNRLDVTA